MNAHQKIDARVLDLHLRIADEIERRPDEAMAYAQTTLTRWQAAITPTAANGRTCSIKLLRPSTR